ncbi:MAG: SurA N-terminal domain-containing protein [Bacteroidetes bacterium]|nr:SurA N-terminal domain-containing protein [Bacteroidota bacterium]
MAVIEKIRGKANLLLVFVGFSLVAFILGDFFSSNSGMSSSDANIGEIDGKKINVMDFEEKVQVQLNNYKLQSNSENVDQNTTEQIREQTWNQLINEMVLTPQYEKLGITCSPKELLDMVQGKNPHPQVKQAFTDPKTGVFNPANVSNFLKNMDNDQTGKTRQQWVVFEKAIREERIQQKYYNLIKQGLYISKAEAKDDFFNRTKTASVRYVTLNYASIADTTIAVTDAELKTLYNATMKKYKQEASANIDYVTFEVYPSDVDRQAAMFAINKLTEEFKVTENDSMFVALNSDSPFNPAFNKKGSLPLNIDSIMFSSPVGFVMGPYLENNVYKLAKVSAVKMLPDSVKASHILLKMDPAKKDAILATADSIKTALKGGANFAILAFQYSTDEGSKIKGGDLGWFSPGMMVAEFNDACFNGAKGDYTIVESQFGIHIIHIVDQGKQARQLRIAYVDKKIEPSSKTYQAVYSKANGFASKNAKGDVFEKSITEEKLTKMSEPNIFENARQVGAMENSRELVRWAFTAKIGEVSKAFEFGNRFVVAKLNERKEKGYSTLEQIKDQLTAEVRRDKKATMLIEKLNKGGQNLDAVASANGQTVQTADNVSFASPVFPSSGMEPYVVGYLMNSKAGQVSAPIKGASGVFVAQVVSFADVKEPSDLAAEAKQQLGSQLQNRSQYETYNALREKAGIVDRRSKFY